MGSPPCRDGTQNDVSISLLAGSVKKKEEREGEVHTYQTYLIQAGDRDALQAHLRANGVEAIVHYATPLHLQPAAADLGYGPGSFPVTERLSDSILSLPLFPGMRGDEREYVAQVVHDLCRQHAA